MDLYHVDPVVKILAEGSFLDLLGQVGIRGHDETHVHFNGRAAADALKSAVLEKAQKLDLQVGGQSSHIIKKERSAICLFHPSTPYGRRSCGRSCFLAEKFFLQSVTGERRAFHDHKRLVLARAAQMYSAGHQFLARAGFAGDEHGRGGGGGPPPNPTILGLCSPGGGRGLPRRGALF